MSKVDLLIGLATRWMAKCMVYVLVNILDEIVSIAIASYYSCEDALS